MTYYVVLQVMYRQSWHGRTTILGTNKTSIELQVPFGEDYIIEITALTEGGDGISSGPIHIPKMSSKFPEVYSFVMTRDESRKTSSGNKECCVTNPLEQLRVYKSFSIVHKRSLEVM